MRASWSGNFYADSCSPVGSEVLMWKAASRNQSWTKIWPSSRWDGWMVVDAHPATQTKRPWFWEAKPFRENMIAYQAGTVHPEPFTVRNNEDGHETCFIEQYGRNLLGSLLAHCGFAPFLALCIPDIQSFFCECMDILYIHVFALNTAQESKDKKYKKHRRKNFFNPSVWCLF